jgi:hypothetical protein
MSKVIYSSGAREFLNDLGRSETGSIHGSIRVEGYGGRGNSMDANLIVYDCNQSVRLEFSTWINDEDESNEEEKQRILRKVQRLRKVINEFCDRMEEGLELV